MSALLLKITATAYVLWSWMKRKNCFICCGIKSVKIRVWPCAYMQPHQWQPRAVTSLGDCAFWKYARAKVLFFLSTAIDQMLLWIESVNFVFYKKDEKKNYGIVKCWISSLVDWWGLYTHEKELIICSGKWNQKISYIHGHC